MVLAVSGNIDSSVWSKEIKRLFSGFKKRPFEAPEIGMYMSRHGKKVTEKHLKKEQSIVLLGFNGVKSIDPERYIFDCITAILSGMDGRLFANLRDDMGLAYSLGSLPLFGMESGAYLFYVITTPENIDKVQDALVSEIRELKSGHVSEDELAAAKRLNKMNWLERLQGNGPLALNMAVDELKGLGYLNFKDYGNKIDSVTAGQLKRVVNEYLDLGNCVTVIISDSEAGGDEGL